MTHHTPPRIRSAGLAALAGAADALAAAARRANTNWDRHRGTGQDREERLRELEQLVHSRELVLEAVVGQLGALARGEQSPPWPEATDDAVADAAVAAARAIVGELRDREAGLVSAFVSLAQRWQTTAHKMEHLAHQVLRRDPDNAQTLQDYYSISHAAATQARASQTLTVLAGRYPGRQWPQPQPLAKVVQHASARIVDYPRVQVTSNPDVAVTETLAEQLIHLLAELLDNATRYSPPSTPVTVTFDKVDAGWAITVHDDGHGLDAERLAWAQDRLSRRVPVGLHELGEPPRTGFAVVAEIARKHGFLVRLDGTANGGVRAVTTVPQHVLVPIDPGVDVPVTPAPRQPARTPPPAPATPVKHRGLEDRLTPTAPAGEKTPGGLPIRVPQRQAPDTPPRRPAPPLAPAPDPAAEATFMTAFVQGSLDEPGPQMAGDAPATTDSEEPR
ncbi:sensor histidine kinase [Streptomyces sp. MN03-5084-2B]|nr:sensor histidine kinase [Streptomyces sp. MN03-5084-2B]